VLLAHFTSINKLELILDDMSLRFGCLENTNDPYENRNIFFTYRMQLKEGGRLSTISDYYYKDEKSKNKFYLLCFSNRLNRSDLINKPRMWSQYANNHNGCCIILNKKEFDNSFSRFRYQRKDSSEIFYNLNKIHKKITDLSYQLSKFVDEETKIEIIRDFLWEKREYYLFRKMEDWREEAEYRYCVYSSKINDNITIDIKDSIERIVLGDKVSNFMRNAIWVYCKVKKVHLTQIFWNNGYPVEQDVKNIIES